MEYKEHNAISIHTQSEHIGHSGTEHRGHSRTEYTGHFRYRTYSSLLVQNIFITTGTEHTRQSRHRKSLQSSQYVLDFTRSYPAPAVSISDCVFSPGFPWLPISVHTLATDGSPGVTSGVEHESRITETL